jgi:hypothetical protein
MIPFGRERLDEARKSLDVVAAVALAVGGAFGLAGTFVSVDAVRQELWAIDGMALVVATALLAVRFLSEGRELVAAGFLVFLAGQTLIVSGNAAGLAGSVPSYGGGVSLWAAGLVMIGAAPVFPFWCRATGVIAAGLFAVTAALIAWGVSLPPTAAPLPTLGYPFLVLTFVGWIVWLVGTQR